MKFGLLGINSGLCALDPAAGARIAAAAEDAGWESLWAGEHYVLPEPEEWSAQASDEVTEDGKALLRRQSGSNATDPDHPFLDPFVSLTNLAAHTSTILLATGVIVLPLHQPAMLAKKVSSLARVSGNRLVFGVGAGYLEPEFKALGLGLAGRGRRTDEALEAMGILWTGDGPVDYHGNHFTIAGVRSQPQPEVRIPVVVGGHSDAALRRTVAVGSGWYGWDLTAELAAPLIARIAELALSDGRSAPLEITVTPTHETAITPSLVAEYRDAGVDRLAVLPPLDVRCGDEAGFIDYVRSALPR